VGGLSPGNFYYSGVPSVDSIADIAIKIEYLGDWKIHFPFSSKSVCVIEWRGVYGEWES
jgi:hypothetical protein